MTEPTQPGRSAPYRTPATAPARALIVANCSGFYGDRLSAAEEVVRGGPIDVLTGDYLAELTMAILHRQRTKNPRTGYVPTFLRQMETVLGECLDRGIKIVVNAGGLNPAGLAEELGFLARGLGLRPRIAYIDGDDLLPRLPALQEAGEAFVHMDRGTELRAAGQPVLTANAYLGGWGIREALARGADVVLCPRVTDAALVVGPAAWFHGWQRDAWDKLAGAVVAGHVIECGPHATGGNYAFLEEVPSFRALGFPLAEIEPDGAFVVTKHPGTGGLVSVGTVTAQLLYEIQGPRYVNPDVVARFDTLRVASVGPDRVRVSDARGEPPPATTKVAMNLSGGFRNTMTVLLTGLDIPRKAQIVEDALFDALGGREQFAAVDVALSRTDRDDARATNEQAMARLRISVASPDPVRVGRAFSSKVIELAVSSVAGFAVTSPPDDATPSVVFWPALVGNAHVRPRVVVLGDGVAQDQALWVEPLAQTGSVSPATVPPPAPPATTAAPTPAPGPTVRAPLGRVFGARSGDKGGNANVGVWAKTPDAFAFLRAFLTAERLRELVPEAGPLAIERHELANLLALNFVIVGLLGDGVASSARVDPQAKSLGEYLRSRVIDLPAALLPGHGDGGA